MSDLRMPLDGVVVVSVEQAVAAPFATRQLADLGARVIKIERRDRGDFARHYDETVHGLSSVFVWLNRGKESMTLDLKQPAGKAILDDLLRVADVFVHNISPEAARRAGLDTETLLDRHERLIPCAISGYGRSGPLADVKAYDLLVQGEAGLMSVTGTETYPAKVGVSIADISAGMYAYSSILAALLHRERTGQTVPVDIALFDSLVEWMSHPLYYTMYGGTPPRRMGTSHATIAPYGAFDTRDGRLLLAVQNDREWTRLCTIVLDAPELADDPRFVTHHRRVQNRQALDEHIGQRLLGLDLRAALELLGRADIACARLNDVADLPDHEQLAARDRWVDTHTPAGRVRTLAPPWPPQEADPCTRTVPDVGAHTAEVLQWLGLDTDTIDELRRSSTI
jgi:itaconate CoA-transferase